MKRDEHICTMAIRGTDGTTVIGPDAKVSSKGYKEGIKYIHVRGGQGNVGKAFMDYYQDYVRPRHLIRGLKQGQGSLSYQKGRNHFGNVCKQWYYTGHSLGGAIASMAFVYEGDRAGNYGPGTVYTVGTMPIAEHNQGPFI